MSDCRAEGHLERRDLQRLIQHMVTRTPAASQGKRVLNLNARPFVSLLVLCALFAAALAMRRMVVDGPDSSLLLVGLLTAVMILSGALVATVVLAILFTRWLSPRAMAKQPGALGRRSYELVADGLRQESDVSDGLLKWAGITEVERTDAAIFVYQGNAAHIVPRRFFAAAGDYDAFYAALRAGVDSVDRTPPDLPTAIARPRPPQSG